VSHDHDVYSDLESL